MAIKSLTYEIRCDQCSKEFTWKSGTEPEHVVVTIAGKLFPVDSDGDAMQKFFCSIDCLKKWAFELGEE